MQKFKKKKGKRTTFYRTKGENSWNEAAEKTIFSLNQGRWTWYVAQLKKWLLRTSKSKYYVTITKTQWKKIAYDAIYDCMFRVIYPHFTYMYVHVVADFDVIFNMLKYAFQHYSTSILDFLKRMSQYCSELTLFLTRQAKPSLKLWNESLTVSVWFLYLYILSFLF